MMRLALCGAVALAISGVAPPLHAQDSSIRNLQALDAKLFEVGWRLVTGNAEFCANAAPAIGLLLHDAHAYGDAEAVRRDLALTGDIGVQAVAPGSPAALAGLSANATVTHKDGEAMEESFPPSDPRWQRLVDINDAMELGLAADGRVALTWSDGARPATSALITGVPACPTRFEVLAEGKRAVADGQRVILGHKFPGFDYSEPEFAAIVAHELAHNLLRHRVMFDKVGRKRKLVRLSERDADRLMPWLLANAGYDPHAASRFMAMWGPKYSGGIFRKRTHDGWDERLEFIEAEVKLVEQAMAEDGKADWSRRFVEMVDDYERD